MRMLRRRRERGRRRFEERGASVGSGLAGSVPGDGVEEVMLQDYAANLALLQREAAAVVSVLYAFPMIDMVPNWYHISMATNLRLRPDIADALRAEAARTGKPQQQIIRDALEQYLASIAEPAGERQPADRDGTLGGLIRPARRPYGSTSVPPLTLRAGETTADLLDRDDRF